MEFNVRNFIDKGKQKYVSKEKSKDIDQARITGQKIKKKYGGKIPESIIKANFKKRQQDAFVKERSRAMELGGMPELGPTNRGGKIKALSRFPWNVGEIFLKLYTKKEDKVFDPFAGHNSRMEIVHTNNRHYQGYDISHEFMNFNKIIKKQLLLQQRFDSYNCDIILIEKDSTKIEIEPNSFDFSITSPPYWDLEYYGDEIGQLSNSRTYKQFIDSLRKIVEVSYNALKKDSFIVWCINDFRRKKIYYTFHIDIVNIFQEVGFKLWDIVIIDLGNSVRSAYPNQFEKYQILPKRHEYAVIGRK